MGQFITGQVARERFGVLLDTVDEAYAQMRGLSSDEVGSEFRVQMAERLETQERTNRALMYRVFGEMADPPDEVLPLPALIDQPVGAVADHAQRDQAPDEGGRADPAPPLAGRAAAATRAAAGRRGGRVGPHR